MQLMHKRIQKRIDERKQERTCRETFRLMAEACHRIALLDMETGISRLVRSDTGETELSGPEEEGIGRGIRYDSWLGRTSRELVHPDFREEFTTRLSTEKLREKFCQGQKRQSLIYRSRCRVGGEYRWLQAEYIVRSGGGEVIYYISDISDRLADMENNRRELEEGLKRARQENSIKMQFMEHLCQEVRIPAGAVTGMNRLAVRSMERGDREGARYYHAVVDRLAEYMKRLTSDVVDTAAVERDGMALSGDIFSVQEVQEECHAYSRSLVRDQELSLVWNGQISGSYRGDRERIKLAFFGIIENAVRYNRMGGDIRVTSEQRTGSGSSDDFMIRVTDSGRGMTEEQKKKLFMPFARSRRDGTGIGLSVAKYVMDAMGGSIEVVSEYGAGTAVTMKFPLARAGEEAVFS